MNNGDWGYPWGRKGVDPGEENNVFEQHPDVIKDLQKSYLEFWKKARPLMVNEDASLVTISRSNCINLLDSLVSEAQGRPHAEAAIDHSTLFRWDFA